ncbi:MAG: hypothetical protein ACKVT0_03755 [Planctomycetaceae bacterium]
MHRTEAIRVGLVIRPCLAACFGAIFLTAVAAADDASTDRFAGFPVIGKYSKGERSTSVIASDPVEGLLRPKWTRAMADLGSSVGLYRYKDAIYFVHGPVDGHRGIGHPDARKRIRYVSRDEGKTWQPAPLPEGVSIGKYVLVVGDKLWDYWFEDGSTCVQTSDDNENWTPKQKVYQAPYWLYEVNYDPVEKLFWCAAQSMASGKHPDGTDIERDVHLVRSPDGINWEHVSTLPFKNVNISEAAIYFEPDRTMCVIVRRKWSGDYSTLAVARPPYTEWSLHPRPEVAEGHRFFVADGQVFMGSRAYYRDEIPEIKANPSLRYASEDGVAYTVIHRFTADRKFRAWAVVDSMGDCSYPRILETPTEILVGYYSEHEDNICKPYLAAFDKEQFLSPIPHDEPDAAGFPQIGKTAPGKRSAEVITSDLIEDGRRPTWTRAMADQGGPANMYRLGGNIYFSHGTGEIAASAPDAPLATRYVSEDEGRTWNSAPLADGVTETTTTLPVAGKLFRYSFDGTQSFAQVLADGGKWSAPENAYQPSFKFYRPTYDSETKLYWAVAHIADEKVTSDRQNQVLTSPDGIHWSHHATMMGSQFVNDGEIVFTPDRTALAIVRFDEGESHIHAVSQPPYKEWKLFGLPFIVEEHSILAVSGRIFIASRMNLQGDPDTLAKAARLGDERPSYVVVHRLAKNGELQPWGILDSMGRCGTPRLVETPTEILCAYYSQHEDGVVKPYLAAFDKQEFVRKR